MGDSTRCCLSSDEYVRFMRTITEWKEKNKTLANVGSSMLNTAAEDDLELSSAYAQFLLGAIPPEATDFVRSLVPDVRHISFSSSFRVVKIGSAYNLLMKLKPAFPSAPRTGAELNALVDQCNPTISGMAMTIAHQMRASIDEEKKRQHQDISRSQSFNQVIFKGKSVHDAARSYSASAGTSLANQKVLSAPMHEEPVDIVTKRIASMFKGKANSSSKLKPDGS